MRALYVISSRITGRALSARQFAPRSPRFFSHTGWTTSGRRLLDGPRGCRMAHNASTTDGADDGGSARKRARTAYVALGSNLGDRIGWIEKACNEMDTRGIRVLCSCCLWVSAFLFVLVLVLFVFGVC